jgi:hypothetical protein
MRKPGRVSAAELTIVPAINGENPRLDPPAYLSKSAQMLFIEIVASCDHRHFTKSDLPLLASLVEATLMARASAGDLDRFSQFERAARLQASLATRLRLTPQSRHDPKTVARRSPVDVPYPWEEEKN